MSAMPLMLGVLCLFAIAYRYYSAFLAAKVATLDDTRITPAEQFNDGQNYHPTSKWVLFGHHFAAISGAGPLIGPVLAAQFGYLPGLLWIVIGVCLGGAVQDFISLAASLRRGGKGLAQIAFSDIGRVAGWACTVAILFVIIIAMAGLGKVVVKALGGEEVKFEPNSVLVVDQSIESTKRPDGTLTYHVPANSLIYTEANPVMPDAEKEFMGRVARIDRPIDVHASKPLNRGTHFMLLGLGQAPGGEISVIDTQYLLTPSDTRLVPGSAWGTFTIACTIPIALLVGLWMYKIRPGRVIEASLIGAALTLGATFLGGVLSQSSYAHLFNLSQESVTISMAVYGFVAAILPIWFLLVPRDYLSSFLKIGTILVLVLGVLIANPRLEAPAINHVFLHGGPTVPGQIFPFLFITIMCGAISGFHSLVSSGTTSKMVTRESHARTIGYGAMLIEGLVGVVAMIAAATLPVKDYYSMNVDLAAAPKWADRILMVGGGGGPEHITDYETLTQESLRGRTGGAVTLAVGMARVFDSIPRKLGIASETALNALWKYWYHFAVMFEALFILTTIDAGTRIGRFVLQEMLGKAHPALGVRGSAGLWSGIACTAAIVLAWAYFLNANSMAAIWPMFGVANQMLSVIALAVCSVYLVNSGKAKYLGETVLPMCFVLATTSTAAIELFQTHLNTVRTQLSNGPARNWPLLINSSITGTLLIAMLACAILVLLASATRIWQRTGGLKVMNRGFDVVAAS